MSRCRECKRYVFMGGAPLAEITFCAEHRSRIMGLPWSERIKRLWPEEDFIVYGRAYWESLSSRVSTGFTRLLLFGIFGPLGLTDLRNYHAGIIGVSRGNFVVIDLHKIAGDDLGKEWPFPDRPRIYRSPLANLSAEATLGHLSVHGEIEMKAVFPESAGSDNPQKAVEIAEVIRGSEYGNTGTPYLF